MALMNALAELHQEQDLKLNLKFEIEVLCKNLSIDVFVSLTHSSVDAFYNLLSVQELKPSLYLRDQNKIHLLEIQLSHPMKSEPTISIGSVVTIPTPIPTPVLQPPVTSS
jgi:CCR4-NOT transcription complex subunit 1